MVKNGQQTDFESAGSRRRYEDTLVWREDTKRNFIVNCTTVLCVLIPNMGLSISSRSLNGDEFDFKFD